MLVLFNRAAEDDLAEARDYFDSVSIFAGDRFINDVEQTLLQIAKRPTTFSLVRNGDGKRRARLTRYNYVIVFRHVEPDIIRVLTIKYSRRHPDYGMDRD